MTKPGLSVPVGQPSINPGPRELMRRAACETIGTSDGLHVTIAIPAGKQLAEKTLNPVLGVKGGISVIGTTGVLRPMSEEGFKNSLVPQIDVARAAGAEELVFVPGKIGENLAKAWGLPQKLLVQTSNFIGFMLEKAAERGGTQNTAPVAKASAEAVEALAALGYSAAESLKAVRQITNADELSTEELLKQALKLM